MPVINNVNEILKRYAAGERDFRLAQLKGADLAGANLEDANFAEADLANSDLSKAKLRGTSFYHADLAASNLTRADLRDTSFRGARLIGAKLPGASLFRANVATADFTRADLRRASLVAEILHGTILAYANLEGANLVNAKLVGVNLTGANVDAVRLGTCELSNMNLQPLCRASIEHVGPSTVDYRSILRSLQEPRLRDFLRDCGMPQVFIDYSIRCAQTFAGTQPVSMLQSTFISYGSPDEAFAQRLNRALKREGVLTFFYPEDATFGERNRTVMHQGVNEYDRIVLVCSAASLPRIGVQVEIQESLDREARDGGRLYLIPITLDDYVFTWDGGRGGPELATQIKGRVVGDFCGAETDAKKFRNQLARLVSALQRG